MIRFDSLPDGRVSLAADEDDARALRALAEQFVELLAEREAGADTPGAPTDPALLRLLPDPVPDDPEESSEVRALTEPGLIEHKRENALRVAARLETQGTLDDRDELAWLQWLTDIRLVLATRLGILVDGDEGASETDADRAMQWTYHGLGSLQADLIDALDARSATSWSVG